ncbi:hypothetical protein CMO91_06500 [Candidatus Woesearchaeota archaeon]|nr:hypothetical protein [Candidatus Woesearchaeota archaeon]|tara:strand:- start:349 stop:1017 length:669 start_codon:yes stop_codon:yes gene_type:complete
MKCKHCVAKSEIKAVGFDFDGTLFLTEGEKSRIAAETLQFVCKAKDARKEYVKLVGTGLSTHDKFRKLYRKLCGRPTEEQIRALEAVFDMQYKKQLNACPLVQCTSVLKDIRKNVKSLFLVSLTDQKLLEESLKHCGLYKHFTDIYGGSNKLAKFKSVLKKYKLKPHEVLYVGDAKNDALQSMRAKIHFVGMTSKPDKAKVLQRMGAHTTIKNLCEFPTTLA